MILFYAFTGFLNAITSALAGLFVVTRKPRDARHVTFGVFMLAVAWWGAFYCLWLLSPDEATALQRIRLCFAGCVFTTSCFFHHILTLTREWSWNRWNQWLMRLGYLSSAVMSLLYPTPFLVERVRQKLIFPYWPDPGLGFKLWSALFFLYIPYAMILLYRGYRASTGYQRQQLKHLCLATLVGFSGGATNFPLLYDIPIPPIGNVLVPGYTLFATWAILRYRLMDITVAIRRSVVYSLLVAFITALFVAITVLTERLLQGFIGYKSLIGTVFAAFIIAIGFTPIKNLIQAFVDKLFFHATQQALAAENERLKAEMRRSEQLKAVSVFAAGLAHEIKNPLTTIKTFHESLSQKYADPDFRDKFQRIVGGEITRIQTLVQEVLDFAKPTPPEKKPTRVGRLVDETVELLSNELLKRRIAIERRYAPDDELSADPKQLKQVFLNLLLNSMEAMDSQGGTLNVRIRPEHTANSTQHTDKDHRLVIEIQDTGDGMTREQLAHLFEPFHTSKPNGTGLGMSIVRTIIREHGGKVTVASAVGRGTTVTMVLPR
ncbi:MAG: hypothetical protein HY597_07315 [Candidatus Omnitrophica bacterium]|nr:hypothetical protein [Candidatus Omnitrophota bacterium]